MKKIFFILALFIFSFLPVLADDLESSSDAFNSNVFEKGFGGQKQYTDEDFQKALEEKKSQLKKKKKKKVKGKSIQPQAEKTNSTNKIEETYEKCIILTLSNDIVNGDGTYIPVGHYKIVGVEEGGNVYLDFYQSYQKIARVPAIKTKYDFDQPEINFAKVLPYSDDKIKIIFGSIDFNAWTLLRIVN